MIIFYIVLRAGDTMPYLTPTQGFIISALWFGILYYSFMQFKGEHFIFNVLVTFLLSAELCVLFQITTWPQIWENPLGSPAMVFTWLGIPIALLFDKRNVSNILRRYYVEK